MEATTHLHQVQLSEGAKAEVRRLADGLPPDGWDQRKDGKAAAVPKAHMYDFQDSISKIAGFCKIRGQYGYGIVHYRQPAVMPYEPSDKFQVIVPLKSPCQGGFKIKDQDLICDWATYTTQEEQITAGGTILWFRVRG